MATRSVIRVEGIGYAKIYKHWDGYPAANLDWLETFNNDFAENRGDDAQYKIAQLLRFAALNAEKFKLDNSPYTGWGIVEYDADMGQEFTYDLNSDGTVLVNGKKPTNKDREK